MQPEIAIVVVKLGLIVPTKSPIFSVRCLTPGVIDKEKFFFQLY